LSLKTVLQELGYEKHVLDENTSYFKPNNGKPTQSFADEITHSLNQDSKSIHPKFFYNDKGSELFEQICHLPEYYLTRTEISVLKKLQNDLPLHLNDDFRLIELGSGSSKKTRLILDVLDKIQKKLEYISIDISNIIQSSSQELQKYYDNLNTIGIISTYESGLEFVKQYDDKQNLIAFLGSSFGNFEKNAGIEFLKNINLTMKNYDLFLIGLDLVKDKKILENAYNDSQGVTSEFNLNVLSRINDELDGNFDLSKFVHHAKYNEEKQRIEIYIRSLEKQNVQIQKTGLSLQFEKDELIHTEHSHKYSIPQIYSMMKQTGFQIKQIWQDDLNHFATVLVCKN